MLSHQVFFTLNSDSSDAADTLVAACRRYLPEHEGVVFFAAGTRTPDLNRPVNDDQFHVALNIVFDSRAAHDAYQVSDRHTTFVKENQHLWKQVRVFDADMP